MGSKHLAIDPEVEELLREIASDSDSTLLKVVPEQARRMLREPHPQVEESTILTKAERQLLRAHREEVAHLLRQACLIDCYEDPTLQDVLHRSLTVDRQIVVPDRKRWELESRRMLDSPEVAECRSGLELLEACVANWDERPTVAVLACASLRLVPTNEARMYQAFDCWRDDDVNGALELLHDALASSRSALIRSQAWEQIGCVQFGAGRFVEACHAYERAATTGEHRGEPLMCWLLLALGLSRPNDAIRASQMLDELIEPNDPSIEWYIGHQRRFWRAGSSVLYPAARRARQDIESELGAAASNVVRVLDDDTKRRTFLCAVLMATCVAGSLSSRTDAALQATSLPPGVAEIKACDSSLNAPNNGRSVHP